MNSDFNIKNIGKKLPYGVSDDFFHKSFADINLRIQKFEQIKKLRNRFKIIIYSAAGIAIIILSIGLFSTVNNRVINKSETHTAISIADVIESLSDEDLKQLENFVKADPFSEEY
ncbi:hypothetical protein MASR2M69_14980 [Bacteroidota bacterium]